jgi:hypothetical protein
VDRLCNTSSHPPPATTFHLPALPVLLPLPRKPPPGIAYSSSYSLHSPNASSSAPQRLRNRFHRKKLCSTPGPLPDPLASSASPPPLGAGSFPLQKSPSSKTKPKVASSPTMSSPPLAFHNHLTRRRVLILIAPHGGKLLSPEELREPITRPLQFFTLQKCFFAHHRRQQALLSLNCVVAECSPCGRVRLMLPCVAFACQRLANAPADTHMSNGTWRWAELVMERVTWGRVNKVQVLLQRRACCTVRCACRASACVRCVFDACCRKRWLVLRCVAAHRSGCINRAAAFILVCRLLLPPALQGKTTFWTRQMTETALRCFAI